MPRHRLLFLPVALIAALLTTLAIAKGAWSHNVQHRFSGSTSIKITEPKGFTAEVTVGEQVKKDTIPTIIELPNKDQYVPVVVTAKDGHSWAEKVEVRTKSQTTLNLSYTPPTKATPAKKKTRRYVGRVALAAGSSCGKKWRGKEVKLDVIAADSGDSAGAFRFGRDGVKNVEIHGGSYDVRAYVKYKGGFSYYGTTSVNVSKDNFSIGFGCKKGSKRPAVLVNPG